MKQTEEQRKLSLKLCRIRMRKRMREEAKERRAKEPKARRLKIIAAWINEHVPALKAEVVVGYDSGDRKIGVLRSPGKGREGNRLIVTEKSSGKVIKDHNAAEAYRTNAEVEQWIKYSVIDHYKVI